MSRRWMARVAALVLGAWCVTGTSWAYYYFVYYNTRTGPFNPIVEKFDLNALVNKTVPFYISDQGPVALAPGDSFQAIVSEIRAAAAVWNGVSSSDLRLAYGGLFTAGTNESAPGIDVEFSDNIPPGLLAFGTPQVKASLTYGPNGLIIPITRSKLYLPRDLTQVPTYGQFPSYSEAFFVTMVHEFGHTLGLQHTLTSSVMSTLVTSASSKAVPLGADDIAGISLLYPAANYLSTVGSISGRVTLNGNGVNLASVVALSPSNPAISTLTNPDGTYQINGIPPGQYFVYAHPLPPGLYGEASPNNIIYPVDVNGNSIKEGPVFATQFFNGSASGTRDQQQLQVVSVYAAVVTPGVNFNVSARSSEAVYSVRTYGFSQTNVPVTTAPITAGSQTPAPVVATGAGLLQANNVVTPGLSVGTLGSVAQITDLRAPYPPPTPYIAVDVLLNLGPGPGPKHLLFFTANDLYVLPSGFTVVTGPAPFISSVTPITGAGAVAIAGTTLTADTRILFDGLAGTIQGVAADGKLIVTPPPGPGGYTASVVALNLDGQSSLFLQPTPPTYTYDPAGFPSLTVTPAALVPGSDTQVDVVGAYTNFVDGQTVVGFGTSDVVVKQVTVLSSNHLKVLVTPNAFVSTSGISVTTGLGIISQALGNPVTVANP